MGAERGVHEGKTARSVEATRSAFTPVATWHLGFDEHRVCAGAGELASFLSTRNPLALSWLLAVRECGSMSMSMSNFVCPLMSWLLMLLLVLWWW